MLLAPSGGFTIYVNSGCCNCTGFEAYGRVRELAPDRLLLEPEEAHWAHYVRGEAPRVLHLLEWDGARMAVFDRQVGRFDAMLTRGERMPEAYVRRAEGRRQVANESRPPGRPLLPEALRDLASQVVEPRQD